MLRFSIKSTQVSAMTQIDGLHLKKSRANLHFLFNHFPVMAPRLITVCLFLLSLFSVFYCINDIIGN